MKKSIWVLIIILAVLIIGVLFLFYNSPSRKCCILEPQWVRDLIINNTDGPVKGFLYRIDKCSYKGEVVYGIPDSLKVYDGMYVLYNAKGEMICAPFGGISGRGDGKCPDFDSENCSFIWKNSISYP